MKQFLSLVFIGTIAGALLAGLMQLVYMATGNQAYILLYNVDYWPLLHTYKDSASFGIIFHFIFCIASVIGLFYILKICNWEYKILPYAAVYTIGSGILYFLCIFTDQPPAPNDSAAWFYWTFSHLLFSLAVGYLIKMYTQKL